MFCIYRMNLLKMTNVIDVRSLIFAFKLRDRIYLAQFYNVTVLYKMSKCLLERVALQIQDFRRKSGRIYMVWIYNAGLTCPCLAPAEWGSHQQIPADPGLCQAASWTPASHWTGAWICSKLHFISFPMQWWPTCHMKRSFLWEMLGSQPRHPKPWEGRSVGC